MFSNDDILILKNFCQKIIEKPRPIDAQPHARQGGFLWCDDWRIIEILKYFFNGREMYISDPPPNRLKGNPMFSKDIIMAQAEAIADQHGSAAGIVEHLTKEREKAYERHSGA